MTTRTASTTWPPASTPEQAQAFADVDDVVPPPPVAPRRSANVHLWAAAAALLLSLMAWTAVLVAEMLDHSDDLELAAPPVVTVPGHTHGPPSTTVAANDAVSGGFFEGFAAGYCDSPRRFGLSGPRPGCASEGSGS